MKNDKEAQSSRVASNAIISFAHSDAPASPIASAQSMTYG
jgi:hypothetical protein